MLDVAFGKLSACGTNQVLASDRGLRRGQRHYVLQLIAKAISTAGLVEGRAGPNAAGQSLIQEPAVQHDVERSVRSPDLDRPDYSVPM